MIRLTLELVSACALLLACQPASAPPPDTPPDDACATTWLEAGTIVKHPVSAGAPIYARAERGEPLGRPENGDIVRVVERTTTPAGERWVAVELGSGEHRGGRGWLPAAWVRAQERLRVEFRGEELIASGDRQFCARIAAAVELLCEQAPDDAEFILDAIERVTQASRSLIHSHRAEVTLGDGFVGAPITLLAGTLAHEAQHRETFLERGHSRFHSAEDSTNDELASLAYEAEVLRRLDAPRWVIRATLLADGKHWDVDGDGVPTADDTELQDW